MPQLLFYLQDTHKISLVLWGLFFFFFVCFFFFPGLHCSNYFSRLTLGAKRTATWSLDITRRTNAWKTPGALGQIFPSVCSFLLDFVLCQQKSATEMVPVDSLCHLSSGFSLSGGTGDAAFVQVQKTLTFQNSSCRGYYKRPIFEHLPTGLITVVMEIAKIYSVCLLVWCRSCKLKWLPVSFGKSFRSDLIHTKLLNCLQVLSRHFHTWQRDTLEMEDDVSQAEISFFFHLYSPGLVLFFSC